uniref:Transposase MuDR plant domain-containing protein n=1 Tax=Fagus sylvatica TaxID=28930 RepID=A0A2N9GEK1_FAGSY
MAPTMYIVYLRFNGEIIYGQNGAEYQGSQMKFIRVHRGISFVELETKIFNALQLDNQSHRITVTYRCPQEVLSLLHKMMEDGLEAEDCVGEDVQQMTVDDTAPFTQPSTVGRCTPQLHEIPTSVEDCGPSTRHEYVPLEVNPLHGVHDMMMLEFTADDEEENTDYDNDAYFDDDDNDAYFDDDDDDDETTDVHNDEVDDVVPSLKPKSSSFTTNTWDNINDTSFNDEVTPLDSWDKKQELRKWLFFKSKIEVQYALKVYSSSVNQEYKVKESNKRKLHVCCSNGCSWRMRACMRSTHGFWEITKYNGPHTCRHPNIRKDGKGFVHCRPVVCIDATHLYGKYEGKLMIAMATDANNGIYPLDLCGYGKRVEGYMALVFALP